MAAKKTSTRLRVSPVAWEIKFTDGWIGGLRVETGGISEDDAAIALDIGDDYVEEMGIERARDLRDALDRAIDMIEEAY